MKKLLIYIVLALLAIPLCACLATDEADISEPQSIPDIESIVEPVTEVSDEAAPSEAEEVFESEPVESAISVFEVPAQMKPAAESSADEASQYETLAELLEAIVPDSRLDSGRIEKELLRLINALRDEKGVNALGIEEHMLTAARIRAAEVFESFSHTRPDCSPYNTAFDEAGFSYAEKWHGENLSSLKLSSGSLSDEEIALKMFNGLKSSPGHYRNMTEENFVQAGIGVAVTYTDDGIEITSAQMFAGL